MYKDIRIGHLGSTPLINIDMIEDYDTFQCIIDQVFAENVNYTDFNKLYDFKIDYCSYSKDLE